MIGFFDYTVILTYLSLISAGVGIIVSLSGNGHPYIGVFFLLFCGLCDAFDGKVARTKQDRTSEEKSYGIQIDSLTDLVAFGVLPACIGSAVMRTSHIRHCFFGRFFGGWQEMVETGLFSMVLVFYILTAMIRLAYFNVTEEERTKTEGGVRKFYTGLPVTSAALIFPLVLLLQYITPSDIAPVYFVTMLFTGLAFISKIQVRKPGMKGILIMVGIGVIEFALIMFGVLVRH